MFARPVSFVMALARGARLNNNTIGPPAWLLYAREVDEHATASSPAGDADSAADQAPKLRKDCYDKHFLPFWYVRNAGQAAPAVCVQSRPVDLRCSDDLRALRWGFGQFGSFRKQRTWRPGPVLGGRSYHSTAGRHCAIQ